jgi:limonene-1,2-epoxide hydrolase
MTPEEVVTAFVACINAHDPAALVAPMTDDHVFIDALDNRLQGRDVMLDAWRQYFGMVPDYWMRIEALLTADRTVAAFGRAGGTYSPKLPIDPSKRWEIPAAWRANVQDDRIALWRVYADNLPIRKLMGAQKA